MSVEEIIALTQVIEDMEESSSSSSEDEDDLLIFAAICDELQMETHAKIRDYVDNVVALYSDKDVCDNNLTFISIYNNAKNCSSKNTFDYKELLVWD